MTRRNHMEITSQELLKCQCEHCHKLVTFPPSHIGKIGICAWCKQKTYLNLAAPIQSQDSPKQAMKLPLWAMTTLTLLAITLIVSLLAYAFWRYSIIKIVGSSPVLEALETHSLSLYALHFTAAASCVLWFSFFIYVFSSLREMRTTLKQIEINMRSSQAPPEPFEFKRDTTSLLSPVTPISVPSNFNPEDLKYMPKG